MGGKNAVPARYTSARVAARPKGMQFSLLRNRKALRGVVEQILAQRPEQIILAGRCDGLNFAAPV